MPPLSPIGIFHTILGIVALATAVYSYAKSGAIQSTHRSGQIYLLSTVLTAASALTIFRHGGFNAAHGLAILTLVAVFVGYFIEKTTWFGRLRTYVVAVCYGGSVLFHLLPTATEILTRFPLDNPRVSSLQDPLLQKTFGVIALIWLICLVIQLVVLGRRSAHA